MSHSIIIPIYPEKDCRVSDLFNYEKHQSRYIILENVANYVVRELHLLDPVYHGMCYISVPLGTWSKIKNILPILKDSADINLASFLVAIQKIVESRLNQGDKGLSTWWDRFNQILEDDPDKIKRKETTCLGSVVLLNMLSEIANSNSQTEIMMF